MSLAQGRLAVFTLIFAMLAGCVSPPGLGGRPASLDPSQPVPEGAGTLTVGLYTNSNFIQGDAAHDAGWDYLRLQSTSDGKGTKYNIRFIEPFTGVYQIAFGELPAGTYKVIGPVHVTYADTGPIAIPNGSGGTAFVPGGQRPIFKIVKIDGTDTFTVKAGRNTNLGMFAYEPVEKLQPMEKGYTYATVQQTARFGWEPMPRRMRMESTAILTKYTNDTGSDDVNPLLPSARDMAAQVFKQALANPTPTGRAKFKPDGRIVIPSSLGRVVVRDSDGNWHQYYAGLLREVVAADILPDGRIIASLDGVGAIVSDSKGSHWKKLKEPKSPYVPTDIGVLANGDIYLAEPVKWSVTDRFGTKKKEGMAIYVAKPENLQWHQLARMEDATHSAVDDKNVYLYSRGGDLQATDYRTGKVKTTSLPDPDLLVIGQGEILSFDGSAFGDRISKVSYDYGASWTPVAHASDYLNVSCPVCQPIRRRSWEYWRQPSGKGLILAPYKDSQHRWQIGYFTGPNGPLDLSYWTLAGKAPLPQCAYTAQRLFHGSTAVEICDDGQIWAYKPLQAKPEHVRGLQPAAEAKAAPHGS